MNAKEFLESKKNKFCSECEQEVSDFCKSDCHEIYLSVDFEDALQALDLQAKQIFEELEIYFGLTIYKYEENLCIKRKTWDEVKAKFLQEKITE